jgi:hypothetical protein
MKIMKNVLFIILMLMLSPIAQAETAKQIKGLGLTEQEVIDSYVYIFARYLVIRQEHIDIAEEGGDYNVIKYNELGKAEFPNPNLDVAYLEAWFAVDENTPVILEIPKIKGLYYTAQLCDEWAEIITNINERNYPKTPYGKFALVLKGSNPKIPKGAVRVEVPSKKVKLLGRVERQGDDERAVKLQHQFKIIKLGEPAIEPAIDIPMFTNKEPITVDVFKKPLVKKVIASAPDSMVSLASDMQKKVMTVAEFVSKSEVNRATIDEIIRKKAFPAVLAYIKNFGDKRGGWSCTREYIKFDDEMWFRCIANFGGIWWNSSKEVVYYIGEEDDEGVPIHGDNVYVIHFKPEDLPQKHVYAYWSLTLMDLPNYRVISNKLDRYNFNNLSKFVYESDGSLKLYLASELPKGASQTNWLPSPKGQPFTLNLRMYVPKGDVLSGEYYLPPIKKAR